MPLGHSVTLAHLIDADLVRVPMDLEHRYLGSDLRGHIGGPTRVVFAGIACESLSTAAGMARRSVAGSPTGREYPQTNGWTFWRFRRTDGSLALIDELRRELGDGKVVQLDVARRAGA